MITMLSVQSEMKLLTRNSYPSYKPSGIPWLSKVPEHWDVKPLKHWCLINSEALAEDCDPDYCFDYLDISCVGTGHLSAQPEHLLFESAPSRARRVLRQGDTVISTVRTYLKAIYYLGEEWPDLIASTGFAVLRPQSPVTPALLGYLLQSDPFIEQVTANSIGVAYPAISETKLGTLQVPISPDPIEQAAIVRFLDHADEQIQRYIASKERLIALLEEERQALVHQAVTRGLDPSVRLKPSGVDWLGEVPEHWELRRIRSLAAIGTGDKDTINRDVEGKYPFFVRSQNVERIDTWSFDGEAVLTAGDGAGVGKVFHYFNGKFDFHQRVYKFSDFKDILGKFFYYSLKASLPYLTQQGTAKSTVDSLRLPMLQNIKTTVPPSEEQEELTRYLEQAEHRIDYAVAKPTARSTS